jgi:hypothetical protein
LHAVEHVDLRRWIEAYERAWRTPGTGPLEQLFTAEATYSAAPFEPRIEGLEAIAAFWEAERESADESFELEFLPVAVEGDLGVARVEVRYAGAPARVYRDLWIVTLDGEGRCRAFEEWPFFPGQPLSPDTPAGLSRAGGRSDS